MATNTYSPDEKAVRDQVRARAQALRDKNAAALTELHAPEPVLFGLAPPLVTETEGDGLAAWLASWDGPMGYEVKALTVAAADDVAFAHSLDHMRGERDGAPPTDLWFRVTLGFRRVDGRWLIVHEHQSVPFAMDGSDRALLDLTP